MGGENGGRILGVLGALERERHTGVLRVGAEGAFHIADGTVIGAESRHAPRIGGIEPELAALLGLFDAAYFLLAADAEPVFVPGPAGGASGGGTAGGSDGVTVATLVHERHRRRRLLDAAWPDGSVDVAPVVPVRRVRRQRLILTGVQAEVLLNADGRRTPARLARELGRTAFSCLLAVRGLAAASLVETGPPQAPPPHPPRPAEIPAEWAPPDEELLVRLRAALVELG